MMTRYQYRTPGTRLWWGDVGEWCALAFVLDRRRLSRKRNRDLETHAMCMPLEMIYAETELEALDLAIWFYRHGPIGIRRPQRGARKDHPSTPILMALNNRRASLLRKRDHIPEGGNWIAAHPPPD